MGIFIFITCTCCGVLSGIVYDVLYVARCAVCGIHKQAYTVKDRVFTAACDILYCLIFAAAFVFMSVMFNFDGLRLYMFLVIVAFSVKKVYNRVTLRKGKEK